MPSSTDLLDANLWLALGVEAHSHHARAKDYWQKEAAPVVGFCRMTHLAFLSPSCKPTELEADI